jgi:hypothetical protein
MNRQIAILVLFAFALVLAAQAATDNRSLEKFGERMCYFYLNPTKEQYDDLQKEADTFATAMEKLGNKSDVSTAVLLARISEKYDWDLIGKSKIDDMAGEIRNRQGQLAK